VVHGDLKPQNVLVDYRKVAKLADFGGSKTDMSVMDGVSFSRPYLAPEAHRTPTTEPDFGKPMDVFSIGLVLWELFNGGLLGIDFGGWSVLPTLEGGGGMIPRALEALAWSCTDMEKLDRPTADEVLENLTHVNVMRRGE
jgi:serine/threonine protein kinase